MSSERPRLILLVFWIAAALAVLVACDGDEAQPCESSSCESGALLPTPEAVSDPVFPGADWETSSPEDEGMEAAPLENIDPYCVEHGCRAVVMIRHGRVVWERYWGGWNEASLDNSWSMAKSVTSALVGIAIEEGKIENLDQSASDFLPEWRGDNRAKITIRDLLSMESGLTWTMTWDPPLGDTTTMMGKDDQTAYAVNRQTYREPGTDWYYSDGDAQAFSRIIEVATGMTVSEYAQEKLFGPLGMESTDWLKDKSGQAMTYCCIMTTARDFARFGYLYLREGRWGDEQIVPAEWVEESTQPSQMDNTNYGFFWWLFDFEGAPTDTYAAMGMATKRTYVIPSLDVVVVRLGEGDEFGWNDGTFLKPVVEAVRR